MAAATDVDSYYIYALIDPAEKRATGDDLLSTFYVGKGRNDRLNDHERDELRDLDREMNIVTWGSKAERIRDILGRGERIQAIRLSTGYRSSDDAFRAESLAIALISSMLKVAGKQPLTNGNPGNYSGFLPVDDHFRFVASERFEVLADGSDPVLLVKGIAAAMPAGGHRVLGQGLPEDLRPWQDQITILTDGDPDQEYTRRGWDPDDPWDDTEARERGRRYWRIKRGTIAGWLQDPETSPRRLLLAIPAGADTVVRYMWDINADGVWEYCVSGSGEFYGWGIPLGKRLYRHRLLGKSLIEDRNGKLVQVLQNYNHGWRVLNI
jgi:hypothetical protein